MPDLFHHPGAYRSNIVRAGETKSPLNLRVEPREVRSHGKVTGTVKGDQAEWSFESGQAGKVSYKAVLDGSSKMKGSVIYGQLGAGTFTAERKT
jgi:hypothetical protein